ncbi:antitoxin Xre-like helix-turn-helix domain-containing protein [Pseudomonas monteilii]|uniref:Antitoxin Xre-like helix-turn-helix domain-containing protein n=1 Tax=Pseudomonas monteilii TaxID=76759 RepID=A0A2N1IRT0_9PSED|nr:antitoxin Xre-like helix-turn-helix domain-containing protein [Pseudomonas monteilii]PKI22279.1 hypothetical protein CXB65_15555 [Pseudomonas monteilii]RPD94889.1 hypothetical protein EGN69_01530 [Pseudomonas monteilii]
MVANQRLTQEQSAIGLRVALQIIGGWQASVSQACKILRISRSTYRRVSQGSGAGGRLDLDQHQRIGLVLGIHAALRSVFTNQENVQGFPGFRNQNEFFEGRSPLEIMSQGDMISLYETYKRINQLQRIGEVCG